MEFYNVNEIVRKGRDENLVEQELFRREKKKVAKPKTRAEQLKQFSRGEEQVKSKVQAFASGFYRAVKTKGKSLLPQKDRRQELFELEQEIALEKRRAKLRRLKQVGKVPEQQSAFGSPTFGAYRGVSNDIPMNRPFAFGGQRKKPPYF